MAITTPTQRTAGTVASPAVPTPAIGRDKPVARRLHRHRTHRHLSLEVVPPQWRRDRASRRVRHRCGSPHRVLRRVGPPGLRIRGGGARQLRRGLHLHLDVEHPRLVDAASTRGLAIFCEKPLATTEAGARAMTESVTRAGVTNQVGLVLRRSPAFLWLRHIITAPEAGAVMSVVFRTTSSSRSRATTRRRGAVTSRRPARARSSSTPCTTSTCSSSSSAASRSSRRARRRSTASRASRMRWRCRSASSPVRSAP